jgi:hypothetical protein
MHRQRRPAPQGKMKLHGAAAVALLGWYLMVPPMQGGYSPKRAPLSHWGLFESFDTARECRNFQDDALKSTKDSLPPDEPKGQLSNNAIAKDLMRYAGMFGKCIASDDPRLK